ncbi:MAG TPA: thioredoxin family protein [Casimicrobiaceae bacterium]|nr:thioredoxin family protein [Casimicrobiaceae bacterium]
MNAYVPLVRCVVTLLLLVGAAATAAGLADRFDPARDPAKDVAAAVAQARDEGKRVLVDVGGEWCSWCHIMDRFFAADDEAREMRDRGFVVVKVNYSPQNKNQAFLSRYPRIAGYPHLFVLGPDGKLLHSQDTGELEAGKGYDRDKMLGFLRNWTP